MARTNSLPNFLTDVADAIKEKKGSQADIPAANFDTEIRNLPGGSYQSKTVTITQNQSQTIIDPDTNYDAMSDVTVNVSVPEKQLQTKNYTFTQNTTTTLQPEQGYDGFDQVGIEISVQSSPQDPTTATANDILSPKTAYSNGQKITGAITTTYRDDSAPEFGEITIDNQTNHSVLDINYAAKLAIMQMSYTQIRICKIINNVISTTGSIVINTTDLVTIGNQNRLMDVKFLYDDGLSEELKICGVIWTNYASWTSRYVGFTYSLNKTTLTLSDGMNSTVEIPTDGTIPRGVVLPRPYHNDCFAYYGFFGTNGNQHTLMSFYSSNDVLNGTSLFATNWESHGLSRFGRWTTGGGRLYITDVTNTYYVYTVSNNNATWTRTYTNDTIAITDTIAIRNSTSTYNMTTNTIVGVSDASITNLTVDWQTYGNWLFMLDHNNNQVMAYLVDGNFIKYKTTYNLPTLMSMPSLLFTFSGVWVSVGDVYYLIDTTNIIRILYKMTRTGVDYYSNDDATGVAADLLTGKSMYNSTGKVDGAMPNNGALSFTSSENNQTIPAGYTSGGTIAGISIEDMSAYDSLLAQSRELLYGNYTPKVMDGLLYSLDTYDTFNNRTIDTGVSQSNIVSAYTVFITMYPTAWNNYRGAMGNHGGYNQGLVGFQFENNTIRWAHTSASNYADVYNSVKTLNTDYDMIVTYSNQKLNIWCNGTQIVTDLAHSDMRILGNIIIGQAYSNNDRYFAGKLGYCYIYNRALTIKEIEQMQDYIEQVKEGIII